MSRRSDDQQASDPRGFNHGEEDYAAASSADSPRGIKRIRHKTPPRGTIRPPENKKRKISCSTTSSDNCHTVAEAREEGPSLSDLTEELCGPAYKDYCKCDDPQDPVSLQRIWIEHEDGTRRASDDIDFLFSYWEDDKFVRGFSITTLQFMLRQPRPILHPVSRQVIQDGVLERAERMVKLLEASGAIEPITVRDLATLPQKELTRRDMQHLSLEVWQLLGRQSVYVEEDTLVDMDRTQILMLNSELRSMFTENFTEDQRRQFFPPDGRPFMKIHEALMGGGEDIPTSLRTLSAVQGILKDLRTILTNAPDNMKFMVTYVIVGALAVVSGPIRSRYMTGLSHSFEISPADVHYDDDEYSSSDSDEGDYVGHEDEDDSERDDLDDEF
ncbi:hypothetical protein Pmar_PMAR001176 [Perkinsus marinus ATCC 50983]|uniref:Uncharacterized protein n=1 Tax=Perkinsus marinus (strain ATCC 50983 / TXsc) TaxID=423536 RepID=C5KT27_PERM5|nr:hypothetical protein Pmar_PMAR001176 [Perkinsus marinus ATCC 50983]EER12377.1 hypothetical protein Pmar_PMAR001176 [Perkinsus marinus ATCC 50983]|eukprot:XP_002780582.1 hypothetical protein Pmar_PMAR001176 [Perkinsus marinus ATCC 50983]